MAELPLYENSLYREHEPNHSAPPQPISTTSGHVTRDNLPPVQSQTRAATDNLNFDQLVNQHENNGHGEHTGTSNVTEEIQNMHQTIPRNPLLLDVSAFRQTGRQDTDLQLALQQIQSLTAVAAAREEQVRELQDVCQKQSQLQQAAHSAHSSRQASLSGVHEYDHGIWPSSSRPQIRSNTEPHQNESVLAFIQNLSRELGDQINNDRYNHQIGEQALANVDSYTDKSESFTRDLSQTTLEIFNQGPSVLADRQGAVNLSMDKNNAQVLMAVLHKTLNPGFTTNNKDPNTNLELVLAENLNLRRKINEMASKHSRLTEKTETLQRAFRQSQNTIQLLQRYYEEEKETNAAIDSQGGMLRMWILMAAGLVAHVLLLKGLIKLMD